MHVFGPRSRARALVNIEKISRSKFLHTDPSGCSLGLVDMKIKVAFQHMLLILRCNICSGVNAHIWPIGLNWVAFLSWNATSER